MKTTLALIATALLFTGCASVRSVSMTPIPAQRSKAVKAQVSKTVFLGFNFDNDFIDPLVNDLKRQCPQGLVTGLLTKDEVISYVFVFTHRVTATGYCVGGQSQAKKGGRTTASEADETMEP